MYTVYLNMERLKSYRNDVFQLLFFRKNYAWMSGGQAIHFFPQEPEGTISNIPQTFKKDTYILHSDGNVQRTQGKNRLTFL